MTRVPEAVGRYQVFAEVGVGGFATVYRAYDPVLDREVALKVLHGHLTRDPQVAERFLREGRALARLRHPNLVQVYDAGTADELPYLAMEFVEGRSLAERLADGPLPLSDVIAVTRQVAAALDAIHAAGLIHRDIKPANILLAPDGRAVLLDLGIAREESAPGLTGTGLVVGTPAFLAPEQVQTGGVTVRQTDVYQLAATAYALLAGRPPFEGDTAQVLYAVVSREPPPLDDRRPDLPPLVSNVIMAAMAREPRDRPAAASLFALALATSPNEAPTAPAVAPPHPLAATLDLPSRKSATQADRATLAPVAAATAPDRDDRGGALPERPSGATPAGPTRLPPPTGRAWWTWALAGGGAMFVLALGALVVREVRESNASAPPTAPALVVGTATAPPTTAATARSGATAGPTAAPTATPRLAALTLPTEPARVIPNPVALDPIIREVITALNRNGPIFILAMRRVDETPLKEVFTGKALVDFSGRVATLRNARQFEQDELLSISLLELRKDGEDRAFARTREVWKLEVFEQGGRRLRGEETTFDEDYRLVRQNGRWFIEENTFSVVKTTNQ